MTDRELNGHTTRQRPGPGKLAMTLYADWLEFKAMMDDPGLPPCPFCGIRSRYSAWHPYCTAATEFRFWVEAGKPRKEAAQ